MVDKVKELLPKSEINYLPNANKDERTYKVSFDRITKNYQITTNQNGI